MTIEELYSMPHPEPQRHKRMSVQNRAAQFAPFAALTGYDEQIDETVRTTEPSLLLAEDLQEEIRQKLQTVFFAGSLPIYGTVTYFVPDSRKKGGRYVTLEGEITAADIQTRTVVIKSTSIPIDAITDMELKEYA